MIYWLVRRPLLHQRLPNILTKRNGYIVLVPEIGENLPDKNPLINQNGFPEFNNATIENCMTAIGKLTLELEAGVRQIEIRIAKEPIIDVFEEVMEPLEHLSSSFDTTWGLSKTLYLGNSSLMPTKSYLYIHDRARRARSTKFNSNLIYNCIKSSLLDPSTSKSDEKVRLLKKYQLEGKLNGLDLKASDKLILQELLIKLQTEKTAFKSKIETATKLFSYQIDDSQIVKSFPDDLLKTMAKDSKNYLKGPWIATLENSVYIPFMEFCPDENLRWNAWQAMISRGSLKNKECATSIHLELIRVMRQKQAKLLGYENFADMSMETKMAGSVNNVKKMLDELLSCAFPAQETELNNLHKFALDSGFKRQRLQLSDIPYWTRKQQFNVFNYKLDDMTEAFPLEKVLKGLFNLCHRLFKITIKQRYNVSTWDKDVKFFDIFEQNSSEPIGGFYFDPYIRLSEKNNSGWMVAIQNRSCITNTKPLAALVFNFLPPKPNEPSFLTFKDVMVLFHKFGHTLQHILTRATYSEVAGLSGLEWDVVEVCGHFLTHWLYDKSVIGSISDYDNNQVFDQIRKHTPGLDLCRELYLSELDLKLHTSKDFWLDIVKNLWPQFRPFPLDKIDCHPCSFTQIFVEEWGAAYYSHIWARVIAADVYSAFHEVQNDEQQLAEVGRRFRESFLALGGSCNPNEVFRKFRGRDHSCQALLSSLGLQKNASNEKNT